jgi:hypothetical protein
MNFMRWARVHWDRVGGAALIGLGGVFILVGWNRVSGEALTAQQIPYVISGGIGGLFLLAVGAMLWLSADLRDEWRKLDSIEQRLPAREDGAADVDDPFASGQVDERLNGSARRRAPLRAGRASAEG